MRARQEVTKARERTDANRDKLKPSTSGTASISSAWALDMTHCDFSVKSARDEMRHIIGSSEPDVIIGSDRDQNRECRKKDKDHDKFLCELSRGRHFVLKPTSEVNSRRRCMAKVMAMPGTRTAVADLSVFGLAACDEGQGLST